MPYSLIMLNNYLLALAKNTMIFVDLKSFIQFLSPWYRIKKHHSNILVCLQNNLSSNTNIASKLDQKTTLKAT